LGSAEEDTDSYTQGWYPQVIGDPSIRGTDKLAGGRARYFNAGRSYGFLEFHDNTPNAPCRRCPLDNRDSVDRPQLRAIHRGSLERNIEPITGGMRRAWRPARTKMVT
jgi:hypothetical protein